MIKKSTGNEEDERQGRQGKRREYWTSLGIKLEETKQKRSNQGSNKDGWMDGWMDGWIDGWMDGWMDCILP